MAEEEALWGVILRRIAKKNISKIIFHFSFSVFIPGRFSASLTCHRGQFRSSEILIRENTSILRVQILPFVRGTYRHVGGPVVIPVPPLPQLGRYPVGVQPKDA